MIEIRFYNELGDVSFGKGKWKLTAAEGLGLPPKNFKTASYADTDGAEIVADTVLSRTITLSGDISGISEEEYEKALEVLYKKGTLEIGANGRKRRIDAVCLEFRPGDKLGKYRLFVVQFLCANPYFESEDYKEVPIFKVVPMINESFTFPNAFSKRIVRSNLYYNGNAPAEPILHISAGKNPIGTLSVINHTSGESLSLDYELLANEFITIDVKNRKIYNSDGKNLINYLTDESFFGGFCLYPGENDIEVAIGEFNSGLTVTCCFNEAYIEAVI